MKIAILIVAIAWGTLWSEKPGGPLHRLLQFVMLDDIGQLVDPSHSIVENPEVVAVFVAACEVRNAADGALVSALDVEDWARDLALQLAGIETNTQHFAIHLPRATPDNPDVNIAITMEKCVVGEDTVEAWYWFSLLPVTNVAIHLEAALGPDAWRTLAPISDDWPEVVNGLVRYVYELPEDMRGRPLVPPQEIMFGGFDGQQMQVPPDGVYVQDAGGVVWTPFSGVDEYDDGEGNILIIEYIGGIAVAARLNGENVAR